ncbi:hypothetical protein ACSQ67_020189 [Phaseolus vulgaris]
MSFRFSSPPDDFQTQAQNQFDHFMEWTVIASIASGVVGLVAILAIVYAIVECLKKAGEAIPAYAQLPSTEKGPNKASNSFPSTGEVEVVITPASTVQGSSAADSDASESWETTSNSKSGSKIKRNGTFSGFCNKNFVSSLNQRRKGVKAFYVFEGSRLDSVTISEVLPGDGGSGRIS